MGGGKEVALGSRDSVVLPQFFEEFFGKQGIAILTAFAVDHFEMNYPAASSGVSTQNSIRNAASGGEFNPKGLKRFVNNRNAYIWPSLYSLKTDLASSYHKVIYK